MPSRISGACTPCRSKKQKCSGHHPVCSQCQTGSVECSWPEQRKRGPAKGYIEALEARLHSAESLLLAILPLVNDNVLERAAALQHRDDDDADNNNEGLGGRRSSPPLLNKKVGLEYWESFPLDTRNNIRRWQSNCESNPTQNTQYSHRDIATIGRRKRSPTHSHGSTGAVSPQNSPSVTSQHGNWAQAMPPYASPTRQVQAGAAEQLLNLSSSQRRNDWMVPHAHHMDAMQLDPNLMQPRTLPQRQPSLPYTSNTQQNLFW